MVGTGRVELPTCRLGGDRSIHTELRPHNHSDSTSAAGHSGTRAGVSRPGGIITVRGRCVAPRPGNVAGDVRGKAIGFVLKSAECYGGTCRACLPSSFLAGNITPPSGNFIPAFSGTCWRFAPPRDGLHPTSAATLFVRCLSGTACRGTQWRRRHCKRLLLHREASAPMP